MWQPQQWEHPVGEGAAAALHDVTCMHAIPGEGVTAERDHVRGSWTGRHAIKVSRWRKKRVI